MSDRPELERLLDQHGLTYRSSHAKLVVDATDRTSKLVQGVLVFQRDEAPAAKQDRDYESVFLIDRVFTFEEGKAIVQEIFKDEFSPKLTHKTDVMINRHPDQWTPGPRNLPPGFGLARRLSGWPERVFYFRAEKGGQLPPMPLVRAGLPSILSQESLYRSWLGVNPDSVIGSGQALRVVLPDYRARLKRVVLRRGHLKIMLEAGTVPDPKLRVSFEFATGDNVRSIQATPSAGQVTADVPEFPNELYVFVFDVETGDVLDWVEINPFASVQPEGIETELPPSVLEDALSKGEGEEIEFKKNFSRQNPTELLSTTVAFANARGGRIFVGVTDKLAVLGIDDWVTTAKTIRDMCHDRIEPALSVSTAPVSAKGRDVLVISVPQGENPPYQLRPGRYLIRKGETDRPMERADMDATYNQKKTPRPFLR